MSNEKKKDLDSVGTFSTYSSLLDRNNLSAHVPGVLMWEVLTEGRMPFEQSHNHEVVTLVTQGHRLYRPKMASPALYDIMQLCWHEVSKKCEEI